jgi:hypothetical protein
MENYYLLVAICCLLPFIVGGIIFGSKDKKMEQSPKLRISSAQVGQKPEDLMFREYSSDVIGNHLLKKLKKHCDDDAWFLEATPQLMHDGDCLAYINDYEKLRTRFWENIQKLRIYADRDERFQRLVFSIYQTKYGWEPNFLPSSFCFFGHSYAKRFEEMQFFNRQSMCNQHSNVGRLESQPIWLPYTNIHYLPLDYGRRYELLPDISWVIRTDDRFLELRNAYKYARYEQSVH